MVNITYTNIGKIERVVRVVVGLALTLSVAFQPGTLGLLAIFPLVAVYPVMTGIMGWDPVYNLIAQLKNRRAKTNA